MPGTLLATKMEILGELWLLYREEASEDEGWNDFFDYADIGLPMSYLAWQGMVTVRRDGKKYVEDTWTVLCELISVDPDGQYDTLEALFQASPGAVPGSDDEADADDEPDGKQPGN